MIMQRQIVEVRPPGSRAGALAAQGGLPLEAGSPGRTVWLPTDGVQVAGDLWVPETACGLVIFAHGAGSGRFSPRNRAVARRLNDAGFATLLMDLLTPDEEASEEGGGSAAFRFDIPRLADRLTAATEWVAGEPTIASLPTGYFGASTGAAAALVAAATTPSRIAAVVARGGRPDLAGAALPLVTAPTLMIVGGADPSVLALNRQALAMMRATRRLEIVPGATHLFPEPGALGRVAGLAASWFRRYLTP